MFATQKRWNMALGLLSMFWCSTHGLGAVFGQTTTEHGFYDFYDFLEALPMVFFWRGGGICVFA